MSWAVGYDRNWKRDIGYGVPAKCDHPDCDADIDRGLAYVCGGEPYGGEHGCGLYFCAEHKQFVEPTGADIPCQVCERCAQCHENPDGEEPDVFDAKPDVSEWINWKLNDDSWGSWRDEYPEEVERLKAQVRQ